jgi:hypothetical protein
MAADSPVPLASSADMQGGQFADLVRDYSAGDFDQLMIEATRVCEGIAGRRLAPFTGVPETHRANRHRPGRVHRRRQCAPRPAGHARPFVL